jgi:hypothetical protein
VLSFRIFKTASLNLIQVHDLVFGTKQPIMDGFARVFFHFSMEPFLPTEDIAVI